ncbi:hypothetical protein BSL78_03993 [Apostichopus japonicus]|uniref:Uncharacterized protein n=1 Tax=Stichopus japonicus TaxID=307972 RepID=A0A2G8LFT5_STIJA|nr:hypothetical protein BSL78_03993 [Apostichopus japonicus]
MRETHLSRCTRDVIAVYVPATLPSSANPVIHAKKCKGRHPTVLHDNDKIQRVFTQEVKREPKEADTAVALTTYHGHSSTTNVLPVWVSSISSPQTEKLVYALLDTQSDSTFIDGSICEDWWSVVGSLAPVDSTEVTGFCHRISLKEAPPVTPRDILKVFESDFNDSKHESNSISQDDIRFLQILESSVAVNEKGHIEMPLPFKSRPYLPNNYKLAAIRLSHLKRRLDGDPNYKEHYVKFVEGMLEDGDAVQVADRGKPGEVYYIPHHGVYHPKKPNKLRVVFDCSANIEDLH